MGIDRRKDQTQANQVKLAPVPRSYPDDLRKLLCLADFCTKLLDEAGPYKDLSLRRVTTLHVEFKDNGLVVKLDRLIDGSVTLPYSAEEKEVSDALAISGDAQSND